MPENQLAALKENEFLFAQRAMHGGRTDVRQMLKHYTIDNVHNGKFAKYQDVQSLYPFVQFTKDLPVGVPVIHKFNDNNQPDREIVRDWFGFVECDLEVDTYIHHPVLVSKGGGKLMADLKPKSRYVTTCVELNYALENGYVLKKVYEYHQYEKSTELFKSYLRQYLKIKITCSGMPSHIKNDDDWKQFKQYHSEQLGIELDKNLMVKNAGKKQLAKLMLNSLWGKFAEAKNYSQHVILKNDIDFHRYEVMNEACLIDIKFTMHVGGNQYMVVFKNETTARYNSRRSFRSNLALAAHVTAWGAIVLWDEMNKLGNRVIYHDTDSIVYEYDSEKYNIEEGKYLGEWEDETGGKPIVRFVSTGPKTYAYGYLEKSKLPLTEDTLIKFNNTKTDYVIDNQELYEIIYNCKCKGFTLNSYNSLQANFHSLSKLLKNEIDSVETKCLQFYWNRTTNQMSSGYESKIMKLTYDKGEVDVRDFAVYPHGYEKFGTFSELKTMLDNRL